MKVWIQYLQYSTSAATYLPLVPAPGDRAVVRLDGRNRRETWIDEGHWLNGYRRPVFPAFRILQGNDLLTARPITGDIICGTCTA